MKQSILKVLKALDTESQEEALVRMYALTQLGKCMRDSEMPQSNDLFMSFKFLLNIKTFLIDLSVVLECSKS